MKESTRTVSARTDRAARVWKLHCQGLKQTEIAARLGVAQPTVSRYIAKVEEIMRVFYDPARDDRHRVRQLAELQQLRREAWEEWERSKADAEEAAVQQSTGGRDGSGQKVSKKTRHQTGDSKYLVVIMKALEREAALLGLDAPVKVAQTDADGKSIAGLTLPIETALALVQQYGADALIQNELARATDVVYRDVSPPDHDQRAAPDDPPRGD